MNASNIVVLPKSFLIVTVSIGCPLRSSLYTNKIFFDISRARKKVDKQWGRAGPVQKIAGPEQSL